MINLDRTARHKNASSDYRKAKRLRLISTNGEQILWHALRLGAKSEGLKFRRQHPIHPYIVDFVCLKCRFIVEIDGVSHNERQKRDQIREDFLKKRGYEVLRFTNAEVLKNPEGIVQTILKQANRLLSLNRQALP